MAELYQGLEGEEFGEGERGAPGAGNRRPGFRRAWAWSKSLGGRLAGRGSGASGHERLDFLRKISVS